MPSSSQVRAAIVGASSLKARELGAAFREREFPVLSPRLLDDEAEAAPAGEGETSHRLLEFADEAALLETPSAENFAGLDVIFFAGDAAQTERHWELARQSGALLIDLTGYAEGETGAWLFGPAPAERVGAIGSRPRVAAMAHPAATLLARLLTLLAPAAAIDWVAAQVFEPVSERGLTGIQELQRQTLNLLTFKPLPTAVFGAQVAFNLRAELGLGVAPGLGDLTRRVASEVRQLLAQSAPGVPAPGLRLLQAPTFHAHVVSLLVRFAEAPRTPLETLLAAPDLSLAGAEEGPPDVVSAAGAAQFLLGAPEPDASLPHAFWLHACFDNLHMAALQAVDTAAALLGTEGAQ